MDTDEYKQKVEEKANEILSQLSGLSYKEVADIVYLVKNKARDIAVVPSSLKGDL